MYYFTVETFEDENLKKSKVILQIPIVIYKKKPAPIWLYFILYLIII